MAIRVALIDDEPKIRAAWRRYLARQPDMECVAESSNADTLLELAGEHRPDVVLLDLTMPGLSPFDAMASLAKQTPGARVLVYSAHRDPDLVERSMAHGAWGFVDKLEPLDSVVDAMRRIANGEVAMPAWMSGGPAR